MSNDRKTPFNFQHPAWIFAVCAFLAYVTFRLKTATTSHWDDGTLEQIQALLVQFKYYNNEQSRLLQWGIPELLTRILPVQLHTAYGMQRLVFTTLAFFTFHRSSSRWLNNTAALLAVVLFALLTAFTFQGDLQESAPLLAFTFVAALWAMREGRLALFAGIIWFGGLNNETMLFLPAVYLFVNFRSWAFAPLARLCGTAFLLGLPGLLTVGAIRYITRDQPYLGGGWHWQANLMALDSVVLFLGVFWVLAFIQYKQLPVFLQRCLLTIPLFLIPNMFIGIITETRLLLPLCYFVLPAALWTFLPDARSTDSGEAYIDQR